MLFKIICSKLSSHAYYLLNDLDPIQNNDRLNQIAYGTNYDNGWINHQFIIPFIWVICTVTIGLLGIDGHGSWDRIEFKWERIASHVVFPKTIWEQVDYIFLIGIIAALISFFYLILSPRFDRRCCMQFIWNGSDNKTNFD